MDPVLNSVCTSYANIWIAGNYTEAVELCSRYCNARGLCVAVSSVRYLYTGGDEYGVCVRLINYPRYPSTPPNIRAHAEALGALLRAGLGQESYTIEYPSETVWYGPPRLKP